jgi:hypothetical protein
MRITLTLADEDCLREPWLDVWHRPEIKNIDEANDWAILYVRTYNSVFDTPRKLLMVAVEEEG